jgi:dihydrodipicolinate synthase/N-acetylneuraminate lyase
MGRMKSEPIRAARGVYAAVATPRVADSIEVDPAALFDYLDAIVRAGVDGIVLFGSTGEFVHFEVADRMRVATLAIKRCRVPLLVNVSHSTLAGALDLADCAMDAGAAGLLLMPPYFFHYGEEQVFAFYSEFAAIIDGRVKLYLYNIPQFTNPISASLATRLLATGAFAGIKDSSGDWQMFEALQALHSRLPFQLLVGNDSLYMRAFPAGADGVVSGVAGAVPELMVSLDRSLQENDATTASRFNTRLCEFINWAEKFPATLAIKRAACLRGWKLDHASIPLDQDTRAALGQFECWFREWLPVVLNESAAMRA